MKNSNWKAGCRILGLGFRVGFWGFEFQVSGLGFRCGRVPGQLRLDRRFRIEAVGTPNALGWIGSAI